jgi:asparagine synthase (glutamine-hydrolysing)
LNQLLRYEDRNGMAWGIESRNPFADDWRLAEAWLNAWSDDTWSLEGSLSSKLVDGYSKGYLRKAMEGLVPDAVLWRIDKKGFSVPSGTMTLAALATWEKWILSDRLQGVSGREQRLKALARARKIAPPNGNPASPLKLSPKQEALLAQLFRWAALGCFLEVLHPETKLS